MIDFKEAHDDLVREFYEEGHLTYIESAVVVAIAALKMQIPMVVKRVSRGSWYGDDYYCPMCKKEQRRRTAHAHDEGWYCERCGQKLHLGGDNE